MRVSASKVLSQRVTLFGPSAGGRLDGLQVAREQGLDRLGHPGGIDSGRPLADLLVDQLRNPAARGADHRQAGGQGLQHHQTKGLVLVGVHQASQLAMTPASFTGSRS
jgi:hypothetical protein